MSLCNWGRGINIPSMKYWLSTSWFGTRWLEVVVGESGGVSKSINKKIKSEKEFCAI